ncbi:unnamed protein product, partial [Nesidiocoris tenuis]
VRDIQGLLKPSGGATLPLAPSILAESLVIPGHIGSLTVQVPPNLQNHQSTSPAPAVSPQPRKAGVPMPLPIADPNQVLPTYYIFYNDQFHHPWITDNPDLVALVPSFLKTYLSMFGLPLI